MKHPLIFASPLVVLGFLAFAGTQTSACSGDLGDTSTDAGADADGATPVGDDASDEGLYLPPDDASTSCTVNVGEPDFIDFCFQKQILAAEHKVFSATSGVASSWSVTNGAPDTDGGAVLHSYADDVAYGASLSLYSISAEVYGDTSIQGTIVAPDLEALSTLVQAELATLPATYDGELYMRLRRLAQGLDALQDAPDGGANGAAIDAIADAYGRAIYATYYHPLVAPTVDGGVDAGTADSGTDAGEDAGDDAGSDGGDAGFANVPLQDGILGIPQTGGGFLYDVDQAASGALALADLASRHLTDDPTEAAQWARAAGSVFNHLYTRARHSSGMYYAYLVTSSDPGHDALASVVSPNDALLAETSASVAVSLMRASALVQLDSITALQLYPFTTQVTSPLSGLAGVSPDGGAGYDLWDPTPTSDTTNACDLLPDASTCGGSGFFIRYLPSTSSLDNSSKTIRANALLLEAIHRTLGVPGTAASMDFEPLLALFESTQGLNQSFVTQEFDQSGYVNALSASLGLLPSDSSYTAQANAYAIEALTEQWVGHESCPPEFY